MNRTLGIDRRANLVPKVPDGPRQFRSLRGTLARGRLEAATMAVGNDDGW